MKEIFVRNLNPAERHKSKVIFENVLKFLIDNNIECDSFSYTLEPLPTTEFMFILDEIKNSREEYVIDGEVKTLNQAMELIRKRCFKAVVKLESVSVVKY